MHLRDVEIRSLELQHPDVKVSQARGPEPPAQRRAEALNVRLGSDTAPTKDGGEKLRQCSKGKFPEQVCFFLILTDIDIV